MNTHSFHRAGLLCALFLAAHGMLSAQTIRWEYEYGTNNRDVALTVQETSDGGYITAGYSLPSLTAATRQGYLVKVDRDGMLQWERRIPQASWLISIIPWKEGGWVVAGEVDEVVFVAGLDASGMVLWSDTIAQRGTRVQRLVPALDDGFLVAGSIDPIEVEEGEEGILLGRYDSEGKRSWVRRIETTGSLELADIVPAGDGSFVFTGSGVLPARYHNDMYVAGIDENGTPLFLHNLPTPRYAGAHKMLLTRDGGYLLGGYSLDTAGLGGAMCITKVGADGQTQWTYLYVASDGDRVDFRSMTNMSDGGHMVLAQRNGRYPYLLRLNADGREMWDTTLRRTEPQLNLFDIIRASDGSLVLAGISKSEVLPDQVVIMKIGIGGVSGVNDPEEEVRKLWLK